MYDPVVSLLLSFKKKKCMCIIEKIETPQEMTCSNRIGQNTGWEKVYASRKYAEQLQMRHE